MKPSLVNFGRAGAVVLVLLAAFVAGAQQGKSKADLTGRYEGSAKNAAGEVITVTLELAEKEGAVSGTISSSHGDFPITSGSHQGKTVTLQFDAQGTSGTIAMELSEDKLAGTWKAGDDGGPVDVKKVAAGQGTDKGKS
jgi:hypothetical protein